MSSTNSIPATSKKVIIVEPDRFRSQRYAIDLMHDENFAVTGNCQTKRAAVAFLNRHAVDFAIVNISLPDGNGADLIRTILAKNPDAYVLVSTDVSDDNLVMQAITAGANGYILFSDTKSTIANCLRLMISGGSPVSPLIARSVLRSLHCRTEQRNKVPENSPLSTRELDVMRLVAKGIAFREISQILTISEHTVSTHVKKIYRKLNVHSRGEAVYEARHLELID